MKKETCPNCGSDEIAKVHEYELVDGVECEWVVCNDCDYEWTVEIQ